MFLEKANPALRRVEKRNFRMDETQCLRMIRASLAPSTGCTEPAAIALNAATARKAAQGTVTQVTARLDAYLFKNAMGVGIPGADERGVASGLSASLGVVYLLGGGEGEMVQAARNILGSVSGMICDGAKEGCASKVALSAGLAVEAACLALEGGGIHAQDGILDDSFDRLIAHLGELVCVGMGSTNSTIVHIMKDEKGYAASC